MLLGIHLGLSVIFISQNVCSACARENWLLDMRILEKVVSHLGCQIVDSTGNSIPELLDLLFLSLFLTEI